MSRLLHFSSSGWTRRSLPQVRRVLELSRGIPESSSRRMVTVSSVSFLPPCQTLSQHSPPFHRHRNNNAQQCQHRWLGISRNAHKDFIPEPEEDPEPELETRQFTAEDMEFFDELHDDVVSNNDDDEDLLFEQQQDKEYKKRQEEIRQQLDQKTGRGWTDPWEITDEDWASRETYEDLPDWTPQVCSRVSLERVQVHEDGIPTLQTLARLPLPAPPPAHPSHGDLKGYLRYREERLYRDVAQKVKEQAEPRIQAILRLPNWHDKQDAVDELFESIEFQLKDSEVILGKHPRFGIWVERALEEYLNQVNQEHGGGASATTEEPKEKEENGTASKDVYSTDDKDETAVPVFMDLYDSNDGPDTMVPTILHPLAPHAQDGPGRMVEEWELSAHRETKRIMLRQCTRDIARLLTGDSPCRIVVTGRSGVGKTAALAAIVASARKSDFLVLYLPDGDRLRKHGFYIEPSTKRKGMFDLPVLSQEVCGQFLKSHKADLEDFMVTKDTLEKFFTEDQIKRLPVETVDQVAVPELLQLGVEHVAWAPMCYSSVVRTLMNQSEKPFLMVLDSFNCYYDHGHYFHMEYDKWVSKAIPCNKISLFEPAMEALGISTSLPDDKEEVPQPTLSFQKGGVLVGLTEAHAVARRFTDGLVKSAINNPDVHVVDVPRYSALETEHILANFEATGIGRLRFDQGDTVMNEQEVAYLRMVSGAAGQALLDACII